MLHVSPEPVLGEKFKAQYRDYVSIDLDGRKAMQAMDVTALTFPNETFDAVVCNHVLEHVPNDRAAMAEIYRVLKPGGWASLQVPIKGDMTTEDPSVTDPAERQRMYGQEDHVRQYGRDYVSRLKRAGFKVRVIPKETLAEPEFLDRLSVECENEVILAAKDVIPQP